jgi:phosphoenolpyruvate---glycerone phosphotransferase subunit DhaM
VEAFVIGMLIVSHSHKIAEGVKELADQMTQGHVPIVAAGGTADGSLGTSAELIGAGIEQLAAQNLDGVLVLVDLGSAVMSAEIALEGAAVAHQLSNAPLVEGALMAAVEASIGGDLQRVAAAAEQTRSMQKVQH